MANQRVRYRLSAFPILRLIALISLSLLSLYQSPASIAQSRLPNSQLLLDRQADPDKGGLFVRTENGTKLLSSHYGVYDLGQLSVLTKLSVTPWFVLSNDGKFPLTHLHLQFSDTPGVQVQVAFRDQPYIAPVTVLSGVSLPTLGPGQELFIYVTLNLIDLPPGPVHTSVSMTESDLTHPLAILDLAGTVLPAVTFTPAFIDFGHVPSGQSKTVYLTLRIDPKLAPTGSVPQLYCSNPYVHFRPVPLDSKMLRRSPPLTAKQKAEGQYSYQLTLWEDASIGKITGNIIVISIIPPAEGRSKNLPVIDPSIATAALHSASAALIGRVEGDITAAPTSIVFGTVKQGQQATQSVLISPKTAISLQGAQLSSPTPWLSARWVAETDVLPINPHPERPLPLRLEVILSPNTPAGRLQTELVLTLANGQRLVLPVAATVMSNTTAKKE